MTAPRRFATFGALGGGALSAVACLCLLILWVLLDLLDVHPELPAPGQVAVAFVSEWRSGDLPFHLTATLQRVGLAFFGAMAVGSAMGLAMGRWPRINALLDPVLLIALNIPALVVIVMAYILIGLNETAAFLAVAANKIPNVAVIMREGMRSLPGVYFDVAHVFRLGRWKTFWHVSLPQLQPFLVSSARSGISLIWKIVLVVELLGRSNGVGFQIHMFFQLFDLASILAYTFAFTLVMIAVDFGLMKPWERRASRWRATC